MYQPPPFRFFDVLLFLVVLVTAGAARSWYLCEFADCGAADSAAVWRVQQAAAAADPSDEALVASVKERGVLGGFRATPPLKSVEEVTAHAAPGYPVMRAYVELAVQNYASERLTPQAGLRWLQALLGTLTAGFYFLLARRAFGSTFVGFLAGILCAINPFAVINTAELQDGSLAAFLLSLALYLGVRCGQSGGALSGFMYGVSLAAGTLVRATWLPFAIVALLWFLLRSRQLKSGWLFAAVSFLGFLGALAPWSVRNYQEFQEPIPIVTTAWWHLWVGNNPLATGGGFEQPMAAEHLERIGADRRGTLGGMKQSDRYGSLKGDVVDEVLDNPVKTLERRLFAGLYFLTGSRVLNRDGILAAETRADEAQGAADANQRRECATMALYGALLVMMVLGVLGWRWSYGWRWPSLPLALALIWIPLPYILGHAEALHGPRLPLDGPMLCLAAFALACVLPGNNLLAGSTED